MTSSVSDRKFLADLFYQQKGRCYYCKEPMILNLRRGQPSDKAASLDHKIPKWMGTTRYDGNGVAACRYCNTNKGPLHHIAFELLRQHHGLLAHVRRKVCIELNQPGKVPLAVYRKTAHV